MRQLDKIDKTTDFEAEAYLPDIFDVRLDEKTEFRSFQEFAALAGHLFGNQYLEQTYKLALSWLWRQLGRYPRLSELRAADQQVRRERERPNANCPDCHGENVILIEGVGVRICRH